MSVTLSYDDTLARVTIGASGLGVATYATVERSTNGGTAWTTVRGAVTVAVTAGALATVYDYEFAPGATNLYRVRAYYGGPIAFVSAGTAAHADNASVAPGMPAGFAAGDLLVIFAAIRNSGTGGVNTPTGYTALTTTGTTNIRMFAKVATGSETSPTVTFSAGVSGATTSAQVAAFRYAALGTAAVSAQLNGSGANIAYPGIVSGSMVDNALVLFAGWRQQDWTSVATIAGATEIGEPSSTAGSHQGIVWDYVVRGLAAAVGSGSFVVTGGTAGISRGMTVAIPRVSTDPLIATQSNDIAPDMTGIWIHSLMRPYLSLRVLVVDYTSPKRGSRAGVWDVAGSSFPVATTELMTSPSFTLNPWTADAAAETALDELLAGGDLLYVQVPAGCPVPGGYVVVNEDVTRQRTRPRGITRLWEIPFRVVRAPGPDVVGFRYTIETMLFEYSSIEEVLADNASITALLARAPIPGDVIVA